MNSERWRQIEEIYHAALECEPRGRSAFLVQACREDHDLRLEIESLLSQENYPMVVDRPVWEAVPVLVDESATLTAGKQLGPYRVESLLGAGGMGTVYRARDIRLGRTVALKICKVEFSERFEHEARAVAALNHPNICQLYDIGPNYLVIEFLEGEALKGPLPMSKVVEYSRQILDALSAAHRQGVVHQDLKPANILVTRQGIKLLDFGLARQ